MKYYLYKVNRLRIKTEETYESKQERIFMFCKECGAEIKDSAKFCENCGQSTSTSNSFPATSLYNSNSTVPATVSQPNLMYAEMNVNHKVEVVQTRSGNETLRMIVGIISIVLFLLVFLQSCAASCVEAFDDKGQTSGNLGIIVAFFLLISGVISIAARKSRGGTVTAIIFYLLAGLIGQSADGIYADLQVWSVVSFIFAGLEILSLVVARRKREPKQMKRLYK